MSQKEIKNCIFCGEKYENVPKVTMCSRKCYTLSRMQSIDSYVYTFMSLLRITPKDLWVRVNKYVSVSQWSLRQYCVNGIPARSTIADARAIGWGLACAVQDIHPEMLVGRVVYDWRLAYERMGGQPLEKPGLHHFLQVVGISADYLEKLIRHNPPLRRELQSTHIRHYKFDIASVNMDRGDWQAMYSAMLNDSDMIHPGAALMICKLISEHGFGDYDYRYLMRPLTPSRLLTKNVRKMFQK